MENVKCMMCSKPSKYVKWEEWSVPSKIIYGFCSKVCIANKTIKHRKLKKHEETKQ